MNQKILIGTDNMSQIVVLRNKRLFVVHGSAYKGSVLEGYLNWNKAVMFDKYSSNPSFEDVCSATELYRDSDCEAILAVGGGSAIDVAKCVKLFSSLKKEEYLDSNKYRGTGVPLIAVPTTAGSGSESTHFAVVYKDNEKVSVANQSLLPDYAILIPNFLDSLPIYQKKSAFFDALCHAIESWWSVKSTDESIRYSKKAVELLLGSLESYIKGEKSSFNNVMLGANYSGRAINITQTTAAHALSYRLTLDYKLAHGHAVAICLPGVWNCMIDNMDKVCDPRGEDYVRMIFCDISETLGFKEPKEAVIWFKNLLRSFNITPPAIDNEEIDFLIKKVNFERIRNSPIAFDNEMTRLVYSLL